MKNIVLSLVFAALATGCGKQVPPPASVPAPKTQAEELPGAAVAGSTMTTDGLLNAPGNYIENAVSNIDKAKAAKALFENTAKEQAKSLDLDETK